MKWSTEVIMFVRMVKEMGVSMMEMVVGNSATPTHESSAETPR